MHIGYAIWFSVIPVFFIPLIYTLFLRDIRLKKKFKNLLGDTDNFVQWFQEKGEFPFSSFMNYESGNIIIGKGSIAIYKFMLTGTLKHGRYCVTLKDTDIPDGVYGGGHIIRTLETSSKALPLTVVSRIYNENHPPECIEIENNKAYLYYPLNNWFGYEGIANAVQSAKAA